MKKPVNKKIKIIVASVIVLVVTSATIIILNRNKRNIKNVSDFTYVRTITLTSSSLQETVVASGTIESQTTSTISSSINGATVSKINYSVGDYVEEGDTIIELDTTNLNKQISKQQEKVSDQEESLQERYDSAAEELDDAEDAYDAQSNRLNSASTALSTAKSAISGKQSAYDLASNNFNIAYKALIDEHPDAIIEKDSSGNIVIKDKNGDPIADLYATEYSEKKKAMDEALIELNNVKQVNNYDSLVKAYEEASNNYSQAKSKYKQAESAFEEAEEAIDKGADSDTLDELYDTVSDYKLKAKSSGQITSINAVLGSNTNGTLATIQDTSKLKISLTIDEYDILKLSLGMKASIKTDASEKTYEGEVSQISPVASSSMGSSGGFEIEVKVTSQDVKELLIGMNAEVTIIISKSNENFNVPIDAVEEKEDGTKVIYVQNQNGEFEELEITTGESNGYYIEIISNELSEGMIIRASANLEESQVKTFDEDREEEEDFDFENFNPRQQGGMPGGNMPGGDRSGRGPGGF